MLSKATNENGIASNLSKPAKDAKMRTIFACFAILPHFHSLTVQHWCNK
jgi:hypothetical protein